MLQAASIRVSALRSKASETSAASVQLNSKHHCGCTGSCLAQGRHAVDATLPVNVQTAHSIIPIWRVACNAGAKHRSPHALSGEARDLVHRSCPIAVSNTVVSSARRAASRHTAGRGDGPERSKVPMPAGHIGVRPKNTSQESMLVRGCCSPGLRQPTTVSRYFRNLSLGPVRSVTGSHTVWPGL